MARIPPHQQQDDAIGKRFARLTDIMELTGWQVHSVRGAMSEWNGAVQAVEVIGEGFA